MNKQRHKNVSFDIVNTIVLHILKIIYIFCSEEVSSCEKKHNEKIRIELSWMKNLVKEFYQG